MARILGIDTSNYTTSAALYDTFTNTVVQNKRLLPVKPGDCGIRQSDAVFHHTRQLPDIIDSLLRGEPPVDAVCTSVSPRGQVGSYMPCFLAGNNAASCIASALSVPLFKTSHQHGHIMAALYSAGAPSLLNERFIAFHVSGGTTEAVLVSPHPTQLFSCEIVAKTLDLSAGQLIDRVGVMLGLDFPCGVELEKLAACCTDCIKIKPTLKGADCCLSGFENKLTSMYSDGASRETVAAYTLAYVAATVAAMTDQLTNNLGVLPVVYAGGVMSDAIIKNTLLKRNNVYFAAPEFSCDNAAGVALIGAYMLMSEQS